MTEVVNSEMIIESEKIDSENILEFRLDISFKKD